QVDGPGLGINNQGGDTQFLDRFALRTHGPYDPVAAMQLALEHQNPLVAFRIPVGGGSEMPQDRKSFLYVDPPALLWALKPADDGIGNGVIVRVWNVSDDAATL